MGARGIGTARPQALERADEPRLDRRPIDPTPIDEARNAAHQMRPNDISEA
jgi:hypothetical protein